MTDDDNDESLLQSFGWACAGIAAMLLVLAVVVGYLALMAVAWVGEQLVGGPWRAGRG